MAYRTFETRSSMDASQDSDSHVIHIEIRTDGHADLPDPSFVRDAHITRDGTDLVLTTDSGTVIVDGYFAQNNPPDLHAPDGSVLTHHLVESFVHSDLQFADAANGKNDASPVGAVQEISGEATVTRVNGTVETVGIGTPIYAGDVIETSEHGAVNIVFLDETTFAVSSDARLAIDEYVFDPSTQSGESNFSVLKGVFVFTSGLIGRDDPDDVHINTPAGSIGIRGTIIAGNVDTGEITVVEGAIVLNDFSGNSITLSNQYETARFNTSGGSIEHIGDLSAADVSNKFMSISTVAADLFTSIQDNAKESADKPNTTPHNIQPADLEGHEPTQPTQPLPEDHSALQPLGNFITSSDIAQAGSEFKIFNALQTVQQTTTGISTGAIANLQPLATLGGDVTLPKLVALVDNVDRPPFTVTVTKAAFLENLNTTAPIAIIKGNFVLETNLTLEGVSNNFYTAQKIDANTYEIHLKTGMQIDHEHAPPLNFTAVNGSGTTTIKDSIHLDVLNVNEPTILTNMAPNDYFIASSGNHFVYNFANEFADPDGDIMGFSYNLSTLPGGTVDNTTFGSSTLDINFGTIVSTSSFNITFNALDVHGTILNSVTKTMYYTAETVLMSGGSYTITGADIYTASGNTQENVTLSSNSGKTFTSDGDDTITIVGNTNNAHAGSGDDQINIATGNGNSAFGEDGDDTFNFANANNKAYGGEGSDVFNINSVSALGGTTTLIDGNEGGNDKLHLSGTSNLNFTSINDDFIKNIETISTFNTFTNNITLSRSDVLAMTDGNHTLTINMDNNDTLNFVNDSGGTMTFYNVGNVDHHDVYTDGVVTLLVSDTGSHSAIV